MLKLKIEESHCPECPFYNIDHDEGDYCNIDGKISFSYHKQIPIGGECPIKDGVEIKVV